VRKSLRNDDFLILSAHTLTESHSPRTEKRFRLFLPFSLSLVPLDDSHSALNVRYNVSAITFARDKDSILANASSLISEAALFEELGR